MSKLFPTCIPHIVAALRAKRNIRLLATNGRGFHHSSQSHGRPALPSRPKIPSQPPATARDGVVQRSSRTTTQTVSVNPSLPEASSAYSEKRRVNGMLIATSLFGFATAIYIFYNGAMFYRDIKSNAHLAETLSQNADVSDRWRRPARDFDAEVDTEEWLGGMAKKRKRLVDQAYGNVLEVCVGTGRNMQSYDLRQGPDAAKFGAVQADVKSLTFNDQSGVMLDQAQTKFEDLQGQVAEDERVTGPVKFVVGDASIAGVIKRPAGGFNTIIQTMGICSMTNPVEFLKTLGQLCRQPGEESASIPKDEDDTHGGKILLLEHGKSHYDFLNSYLDVGAPRHADRYGCWYNKDIGEIIRQSGLIVEGVRRYHFGTTWEFVLRPARGVPREQSLMKSEQQMN